MNKPILLTEKQLIKPIIQAIERIDKIGQIEIENGNNIIVEGLFVLAVSSFENSILDSLKVYLMHIPDKLDFKTETISKKELIEGEPLRQAIENKINSISYKNLSEILSYFTKTTSINDTFLVDDLLNELIEIKATRNLLIHNNLIENNIYIETAGPKARMANYQQRLPINMEYLIKSLVALKNVLEAIKNELSIKYSSFTRIKATKNLFDFIFQTPLLNFEEVFILSEKSDTIHGINSKNIKNVEDGLSGSEKLFFDLWIAHFTNKEFKFHGGWFYQLGSDRRKQLEYFISVIDILKS